MISKITIPVKTLIVFISICCCVNFANAQIKYKGSTGFMRNAKFGILVHYLNNNQNAAEPWNMGKITSWDSCVNDFDVNIFATQMHEIGVGYVIFTIQQGTRFMCIPNETFERISGYKRGEATSNRDLVNDLYNALHAYNIRLMLYVTADGTYKDKQSSTAMANPILKLAQTKNNFLATDTWVSNWSEVMRDISMRYGRKISGWWVDGSYRFHGFNDTLLGKFYTALKSGNPRSAVAFNPSPQPKVIYYSKWDDYTAGEMYPMKDLPPAGGKINGVQWQITSFLGKNWQSPGTRFTQDSLAAYITHCKQLGGAVTLDVCLLRNGSIDQEQFDFLKKVSAEIKMPFTR